VNFSGRRRGRQEQAGGYVASVQRYLGLADCGRKCSAAVVLTVLFWAAARIASIAAACTALAAPPHDQALRDALLAALLVLAELQRRLNQALAGDLPQILRRRQIEVFDLTLLPYYGQPQADTDELYRNARMAGTAQFHVYARDLLWELGPRFPSSGGAFIEVAAL
jgi:hypothetical protein